MHHQLGDDAAAGLLLGFQAHAASRLIGVGLVFVQLGRDKQRFEQCVDAQAGCGAGANDFHFAAPFAGQKARGGKLRKHFLLIRARQIHFVHRHDNRHISRLGVADGFLSLRHHTVIRRNHKNHPRKRLRFPLE